MLNKIKLNNGTLWWNPKSSLWGGGGGEIVWGEGFMFNGFSLHRIDGSFRVTFSDHDDLTTMDFNTFKNPDNDWGWVLSKYYRTKTITIKVSISKETEEELNQAIDELKRATSKTEWYLDICNNNFWRRWNATLTSLKFNRQYYNINWLWDVTLVFQCTNPHGWSNDIKSLSYENLPSDYVEEIYYSWSAESEMTMYYIFNTWSAEGLSITVNGYVQEIQQEINAWDVLEYNGEEKEIKLNGNIVRYKWPFTNLQHGMNNIHLEFDWEISYTLSIIYKEKYL